MTGNFQMWLGWLKARTSDKAQWEIRNLAKQIETRLINIAPNIFTGNTDVALS
jgi:thymidylate synthase ThyX